MSGTLLDGVTKWIILNRKKNLFLFSSVVKIGLVRNINKKTRFGSGETTKAGEYIIKNIVE